MRAVRDAMFTTTLLADSSLLIVYEGCEETVPNYRFSGRSATVSNVGLYRPILAGPDIEAMGSSDTASEFANADNDDSQSSTSPLSIDSGLGCLVDATASPHCHQRGFAECENSTDSTDSGVTATSEDSSDSSQSEGEPTNC